MDLNTINLMYSPYFSKKSWSNAFLEKSLNLINNARYLLNEQYQIIGESHELLPYIDANIFFQGFNELFKTNSIMINKYLTSEQHQVMRIIYNSHIIKSINDFYYLLAHLPFQRELTDLLYEHLKKNNNIPTIYKKYTMGSFMSPIIHAWIWKNCRYLTTYHILSAKDDKQSIFLRLIQPNINVSQTMISCVYRINHILRKFYKIKSDKTLNITLILTPFSKRLNYFKPKQNIDSILIRILKHYIRLEYNYDLFDNPITNLQVNSGVTCTSTDSSYITIWRQNELEKVLFHELIHFYSLEKGDSFELIKMSKLNISDNYPHYSKELFTELQTWYIYIIYVLSQYKQITTKDVRFFLDYERTYSILTTCRIFRHFQCDHLNQFLRHINKFRKYMLNLSSSVLYYYIIKSFVLYEIDDQLESILIPQIPVSKKNGILYIEYKITSILNDDNFVIYMDSMLSRYKNSNDLIDMMSISKLDRSCVT